MIVSVNSQAVHARAARYRCSCGLCPRERRRPDRFSWWHARRGVLLNLPKTSMTAVGPSVHEDQHLMTEAAGYDAADVAARDMLFQTFGLLFPIDDVRS